MDGIERLRLPAFDRELDRNVVSGGVRVGTDFLMRLAGESLEFRLREALVFHMEFDGKAESAGLAWADADRTRDHCLASIFLLLPGNKV